MGYLKTLIALIWRDLGTTDTLSPVCYLMQFKSVFYLKLFLQIVIKQNRGVNIVRFCTRH